MMALSLASSEKSKNMKLRKEKLLYRTSPIMILIKVA